MEYTSYDIRHFLYLFRAYGTKPYVGITYMNSDDVMGALIEPDEYNVGHVLMSCIAYYIYLGLSDDEIVEHFMEARGFHGNFPADDNSRKDFAFRIMIGIKKSLGSGMLKVQHVTNVLNQVSLAASSKHFKFNYSSLFKTTTKSSMISLAVHTPSRLQYHPQAQEICKGIYRICRANYKKLGYQEGNQIIKNLIEEISSIRTDDGDIEVDKLRLNDILKQILHLYTNITRPDILEILLKQMYPRGHNYSTTYAEIPTVILLDRFIDYLEGIKTIVNRIDLYPHFAHVILSYFDALCSRVGIDVFEAIIENRELRYSSPEEEGWGF